MDNCQLSHNPKLEKREKKKKSQWSSFIQERMTIKWGASIPWIEAGRRHGKKKRSVVFKWWKLLPNTFLQLTIYITSSGHEKGRNFGLHCHLLGKYYPFTKLFPHSGEAHEAVQKKHVNPRRWKLMCFFSLLLFYYHEAIKTFSPLEEAHETLKKKDALIPPRLKKLILIFTPLFLISMRL